MRRLLNESFLFFHVDVDSIKADGELNENVLNDCFKIRIGKNMI